MKISFLIHHLEVKGGSRRIIELSNHLINRGHGVVIFCGDGSPVDWMKCEAEIKPEREVLSFTHEVLVLANRNRYPLFKKARALLKVFYVLLLNENEKKYLLGFHPTLILPTKKYAKWLREIFSDKKILALSNSTGLKDELESYGVNSLLLLGGINREMFYPIDRPKVFQWKILTTGDPEWWKGKDIVERAVSIARNIQPEISIDTYYGKGISQEKMAEVYNSADIFVDAQLYGGWNNPVAEAMACRVPVVCADGTSVKDLAFNEKTALVVPSKDPKALAEAILRLGKDEGLRQRLIDAAFNNVIQFTWEKSAENLEKIIKDRLNKL
ncbi:MAG: glycosyltransferase family 4 protein [Candidatus Nealsonbacteria bacterium]|nr:glycosyltransferase family 4 protein [Candidatus Nealsonbacteria bacterium]